MAIFTPGAIISEIRGSIANVTYSRSRAGAISKQKLTQTNPNSPAQQAIRALQSQAVAAWQSLSQVDQDLWIAFSSSQLSRPRIDGQHKLSGYNTFIRFYIIRHQYGLSGNPVPAPQIPLGNYSGMSFTATATSLDFGITGDNLNPDIRIAVRFTNGVSPGINSINQSLLTIALEVPAPNGINTVNLLPLWEAKYGPISAAVGMKIFTRLDIVNRLTAQKSVIFRESIFVEPPISLIAVSSTGAGNRIMTSKDGIAWESQVSSVDNNWKAIAYSPSLTLWAAISDTGGTDRVMTSPDGITWTTQTPVTGFAWQSLVWSPGLALFVGVASSGPPQRRIISADGIVWSLGSIGSANNWQSVTWSPGLSLLIAVSSSGTGNRVRSSINGLAWVGQVSAANNNWQSVTWSPALTLFIAVSDSGVGNRVMSSPDGIVWTIRVSAADNNWQSVAWSPTLNLFVAVASTGAGNRVMSSPDGIVWTIRVSAADNDWQSIVWASLQSLFIAVSSTGVGNRVMSSPDGIIWSLQVSAADNDWQAIASI